ncbi:N-fatty-acyl-amino acid synthase/hydrolase PM20D1-like [Saccoglossus kowalevskii]|uniref:Probable carboxypeptidase PM20D1-like n=1 Tax=Saccoglossus kowalevskii TaxID=10224 RepID=A0ABM0GSZ6_SACKO|nr:PREDICTED: probable carboxypeptidase PM20D1-like [Saccoglossus kowalevskii]
MATKKTRSHSVFSKICTYLGAVFIFLAIIVTIRTLTFPSRQQIVQECAPYDTDFIAADDRLKRNLQRAIAIETISYGQQKQNDAELAKFGTFLGEVFPAIHSSPLVKREVVANYSLLYTVEGTDKNLQPYMLAAHMDVVPVAGQKWDYPPFQGKEVDGFIYGRGTVDDKHCLMGILEALEFRLQRGEKPKRTVYIAFGHDEEISGTVGAKTISQILQSRNVDIEFIIDEGTVILDGIVPMVDKHVAMIGVSEKGYLTLRAVLNTTNTGHSSMPPMRSTIGELAKAITRLESNPLPIVFGKGPEVAMFEDLAPEMNIFGRIVMTNLWLFSPIISYVLSLKPSTNAIIRTTTAVTIISGGMKENVLPSSAEVTINQRIHPAQTVKEVYDYDYQIMSEVIPDGYNLHFEVINSLEPSHTSPHDEHSFGYYTISKSLRQVFPNILVSPGLMLANTDTRHYWNLTKSIYRFAPAIMKQSDLPRIHGSNERISIRNYEQVVNFYYHLMVNADESATHLPHSHSSEL